jgi:PAS domain S-box-containing protein
MKTKTLPEQLAEAEAAIRALQDELADTNRGLVALSMELDERVEERTTELARSNTALRAEIAERQRVEEALRASAADWERTFNSVPDCVAILDVEHRIVRANRAMAERLGLTTEQCAGLRCYEAVHGTTQPPDFCPHTHTCRDRRENTAEVHEPRLGGDLLVSTTPRLDEQGRLMGAVHVARDITGRKRAEERTRLLSEVTARLLSSDQPQQIVESLCRKVMAHLDCHAFFNFLVDEQAGRLHLNACAGIPVEAARKIEWLDFGVAVCGCVARDGRRIVAEHVQTTPDPRTDLVRGFGIQAYACHPLLNQGRVIGTLSFGSRTKPAFGEDELRLMNAVADHVAIAVQRIRLLESLEQTAHAAEAANEAKGRFLANISHELRTPMNAILGMIDVAMPKAAHPIVKDCLQTVKGSADLLLTLLNDLLDSSKIDAGKLELESAPFSLRRMLDQVTRVLAVRAAEKGLRFSCRVPEETPDALVGDRTRLQQVLLNLAGNATKFTERGEVEISLRVAEPVVSCPLPVATDHGPRTTDDRSPVPSPPSPSVTLEFSVRDTGIGISRSDLGRIFQPFSQADASTTRRFGGTGLGLSISQSLVAMMGGRIWVESEMGKGSSFYFTVRLPLAAEPPGEGEASFDVAPAAPAKLRILLVEDNPANQKLAAYILGERGHAVEIAGSGEQALRLTRRQPYDVILMDVQMPGMDGLEAAAAIRKKEGLGIGDWGLDVDKPAASDARNLIPNPQSPIPSRRVPIIAMTAHAMKGDRDRCLAAGMDGYLAKPINAREMIGLVESLARRGLGIGDRGSEGEKPATSESQHLIPNPQSPIPVFDPQEALSRCFHSQDMAREMIQCFFDEVDNLFPHMRAALAKGDLVEVGRLGHRMKGTVVYLGAQPAKEAALRVERFCQPGGGAPSEAEEAVNALERECLALKAALSEHPPAAELKPAD